MNAKTQQKDLTEPVNFQTILNKYRPASPRPQKVYSVLAKDDTRWRTVLAKTHDIDLARAMMDETNRSGGYKRIILCQAVLKPGTEDEDIRWQTIECAIPLKRAKPVTAPDDIKTILRRLEDAIEGEQRPKHSFGRKKQFPAAMRSDYQHLEHRAPMGSLLKKIFSRRVASR